MISIILVYDSNSKTVEHCKHWLKLNTKNSYELIELIDSTNLYIDISDAVSKASSDIIFLMDDSICVSTFWDEPIFSNTKPNRVTMGYLVEQMSTNPNRKSIEKDFGKTISTFKHNEFIEWANMSKKYFPNSVNSKDCFVPCSFLKNNWPKFLDTSKQKTNSVDELVGQLFSSNYTFSKTNTVFYKLQKTLNSVEVPLATNVPDAKKITAIINYCTNDYMFLKPCIDGVLPFANKVIVSMCDHFLDGSPENESIIQKSVNENPKAHFLKFLYDKTKNARWHHNFGRRAGLFHAPENTDYFMFLDVDEIVEPTKFMLWWKEEQKNLKDAYRLACHWYFRDFKYRAKTPEDAIVLIKNGKLVSDEYIFNNNERRYMVESAPENKRMEMCTYNGEIFTHHYSWVRSKEEMQKKVQCWGHNTDRDWQSAVNLEFNEPFRGKDIIFGREYDVVRPYVNVNIVTKYSNERSYKPKIATLIPTCGSNILNLSKITDELKQVSDIYLFTKNTEIDYLGNIIQCNDISGDDLPFECKKWIKNNLHAYDYFLYNEDNTLIRAEQVDAAIFYQKTLLPMNKLIGFLRYINSEKGKIFVDTKDIKLLKNKKEPIDKIISHKCKNWFSTRSLYSGNYLIHRSQADWLMLVDKWDTKFGQYNLKYNDKKESAASTVYINLEKYIPTDYNKLCVEYIPKDRSENDLLTEKDLKEILSS